MRLNDASRIIDVIDQRIQKRTASMAHVETTWGKVAAVSEDGRYASAYLYGATVASEYFRLRNGLSVSVGDSIKVAIDKQRGDRWVEEVHTFPTYHRVEIDPTDGEIRLGDGESAPVAVVLSGDGTIRLVETDEAGNPPAGSAVIGVRDSGSGKSQLYVKFPSGASVTLATEP